MFMLIKLFKFLGAQDKFRRNLADRRILFRPVSTRQNFSRKLHSFNRLVLFIEVSHQIFGQCHISEHLRDFIHCVVSNFNLQHFQHFLLCVIGNRSFIQQSLRQVLSVVFNEHVPLVETAEKSNDCFETRLYFLLWEGLEPLFHFIIAVAGNEVRSETAFVHKTLKASVPALLKFNIILERLLNHVVHFLF